jgi:hypothetical protein
MFYKLFLKSLPLSFILLLASIRSEAQSSTGGNLSFESSEYIFSESAVLSNIKLTWVAGGSGSNGSDDPASRPQVLILDTSTASGGRDYEADLNVGFQLEASKTFDLGVFIRDDEQAEEDEYIDLGITYPDGRTGTGIQKTRIIIKDNDSIILQGQGGNETPSPGSYTLDLNEKNRKVSDLLRGKFQPQVQCTTSCAFTAYLEIPKSLMKKTKLKSALISTFEGGSADGSPIIAAFKVNGRAKRALSKINRITVKLVMNINGENFPTGSENFDQNITFQNPQKKRVKKRSAQ